MSNTTPYKLSHALLPLLLCSVLAACSGGNSSTAPPVSEAPSEDTAATSLPANNLVPNATGDITNVKLVNRNPDCAAYAGSYSASINDIQEGNIYVGGLSVAFDSSSCSFTSNNIPNHDVGANTTTGSDFASIVTPNTLDYVLTVARNPVKTDTASYIRKRGGYITMNGILLNGVDLDMDSAFCYDDVTDTIILLGCGLFADWYAVPAANPNRVTVDEYTGHPFDGRYHYHGDNHGLSNLDAGSVQTPSAGTVDPSGSPVIGFAPDGFPIYGHYFYDETTHSLRKAQPSWATHTGERAVPAGAASAPSTSSFPRGTFVEDWYYSAGSGDLDECNGMTDAYGNYGYYYTETYPYGPLCTFGTADASFEQLAAAYNDGGVN